MPTFRRRRKRSSENSLKTSPCTYANSHTVEENRRVKESTWNSTAKESAISSQSSLALSGRTQVSSSVCVIASNKHAVSTAKGNTWLPSMVVAMGATPALKKGTIRNYAGRSSGNSFPAMPTCIWRSSSRWVIRPKSGTRNFCLPTRRWSTASAQHSSGISAVRTVE